jgi:hypothetical protein
MKNAFNFDQFGSLAADSTPVGRDCGAFLLASGAAVLQRCRCGMRLIFQFEQAN